MKIVCVIFFVILKVSSDISITYEIYGKFSSWYDKNTSTSLSRRHGSNSLNALFLVILSAHKKLTAL
jgi:hypothetical protein